MTYIKLKWKAAMIKPFISSVPITFSTVVAEVLKLVVF